MTFQANAPVDRAQINPGDFPRIQESITPNTTFVRPGSMRNVSGIENLDQGLGAILESQPPSVAVCRGAPREARQFADFDRAPFVWEISAESGMTTLATGLATALAAAQSGATL